MQSTQNVEILIPCGLVLKNLMRRLFFHVEKNQKKKKPKKKKTSEI
jgi:hypothetical protein